MKTIWRPMTIPNAVEVQAKIDRVLVSWEGTQYMVGQQTKQGGVDCIRFVCGVLDEVMGIDRVHRVVTLPNDAAMHDRDGAIVSMKRIRELYMPNEPVLDDTLEPGDIVVVGPSNGAPGHAMIVGPRPYELWHSSSIGVVRTGLPQIDNTTKLFRIYRCAKRESWA